MANVVTLEEAKLHLRVTQNNEDALIRLYIEAAGTYLLALLNLTNLPGATDSPPEIAADVKAAALLIIGGMYEERSDKIIDARFEENPAVKNLVFHYRDNMGV